MVTVVAALVKKNNKYLIAKRSTGDNAVKDKWEFPGGKVNTGEDEKCAIEREIKEEFELDIKAIRFIANNICEYTSKTIDLRLYECEYIGGNFRLHDHSEYTFANKDDILKYDLCPADIPLAKMLREID